MSFVEGHKQEYFIHAIASRCYTRIYVSDDIFVPTEIALKQKEAVLLIEVVINLNDPFISSSIQIFFNFPPQLNVNN